MILELFRLNFSQNSTQGLLAVDGVSKWYTLEPSEGSGELVREGTYHVKKECSPKFQQLTPHLLDVPGREYIEIHPGNDSANTEGCILLGETHSEDWVGQSRAAFAAFMAATPDEFDLTITSQPYDAT